MDQSEVEVLVGELETRMERLRTLYDMYFMGIERIEPLVPKKDVERRMLQLRKEQIRNTGLRFKFQTVIQRFNTYQTYWLRISRQIEQGTYARDVRRAAARFGVNPSKERATQAEASPDATEEVEVKAFELPEELEPESGDSSLLLPLDVEDDPFAQIAVYPAAPAAPAPRERFASASRFELDDMADPFEESDPFPRPSVPAGGKLRIAPRPGASKAPPPQENRDTERRMPIAATSFSPTPTVDPADLGPGTVPGVGARGNEPRVIIARRASIPDEMERAPATRPLAPASAPSGATIQKTGTLPTAIAPPGRIAPPAAPKPPPAASVASAPAAPPAVDPAARRPATLPSAGVVFTGPIPAGPPVTPGSASIRVAAPLPSSSAQRAAPPLNAPVRPPAPPTSAPRVPVVAPAVVPAAPASKPAVSRPPAASPGSPVASPAAAAAPRIALQPAAAPRVAPARAAPAPSPVAGPPASRIGDLSGDRFGEIFSKYVETRQKQNEPTHAITRDALAKQLSESTQRLKQKHSGKAIDFEVVVKDGKTILRPVVK